MSDHDFTAAIRLDPSRQVAPQLYEALRDSISSLALPPGTALMRPEIAARFGVSQTPVRDALMRLQEEGLVDVYPQAATRVSKIDIAKAGQAHFLRRAIELEVIRDLATAPAPVLLANLRASLTRQRALCEAGDFMGFVAEDHEFHRMMYLAAGVDHLWLLVRRHSGHIDRLRRLHLPATGKMQRVLEDHSAIVDAVAAADPIAAQDRLRHHLSHTLSELDEIRTRHPEYFHN